MNEWSYTSAPLICPHGMDRDNLNFVANKKDVLYLEVVSINVFLTKKTNWYVHQAVGKYVMHCDMQK
jgi:hypothetical protein